MLTPDAEFCSVNCVCKGSNSPWVGTAYSSHAVPGGFSTSSDIITYSQYATLYAIVQSYSTSQSYVPVVVSSMAILEDKLNCAGLCTFSWFYVFTDVSKGLPEGTCVDKLLGLLTDY